MQTKHTPLINLAIVLAMLVGMFSCSNHTSSETADKVQVSGQTFKQADGWGYVILIDNKVFIKQEFIPAIQGNKRFASETDAAKVAELVVNKLMRQESPGIKIEELKLLGVNKD